MLILIFRKLRRKRFSISFHFLSLYVIFVVAIYIHVYRYILEIVFLSIECLIVFVFNIFDSKTKSQYTFREISDSFYGKFSFYRI